MIELLNCFKKEDNLRRYAFFHLLAYSGMRKSEGFALMWRDIDFMNNEIRITKAVARGKKGLYLGPTKNGLPRTIKLDDKTMELLKMWKKEQAEKYSERGFNTLKKINLYFQIQKMIYTNPYQWLKRVLDKFLLEPITTHGLRHTHCSLLFEAGATIKEVQVRLGHIDMKTTLDVYTHVTEKAKASTIEKFNNYLSD